MDTGKDRKILTATEQDHHQRLDIFLADKLSQFSRSRLQKIIAAEDLGAFINGKRAKAKDLVCANDEVQIALPTEVESSPLQPCAMDLAILYEDEHLLVVNKAHGVVVHPGSGVRDKTLLQGLLHYAQKRYVPSLVHRLDKDTSGVLVCAKSESIHERLAEQFKNKTNLREYLAILNGVLTGPQITRTSYLKRHPEHRTRFCSMEVEDYAKFFGGTEEKPKHLRKAISHFTVQKTYRKRLSLVQVQLETGRTHQIRVHASDLSAPVLGDPLYGSVNTMPKVFAKPLRDHIQQLDRQMLHAHILGFTHPATGKKIAFKAEIPADMQTLLQELENYVD